MFPAPRRAAKLLNPAPFFSCVALNPLTSALVRIELMKSLRTRSAPLDPRDERRPDSIVRTARLPLEKKLSVGGRRLSSVVYLSKPTHALKLTQVDPRACLPA
jgi:hypothetical protein